MRFAAIALLLVAACGNNPPSDACKKLKHVPVTGATHLATCNEPTCGNGENPPTGGDHCGLVVACRSYSSPQPRCSWIHNLEHGHVVLLHSCGADGGCPEIVTALEKLQGEAKKGSNAVPRAIVTPDPALGAKAAATVWGWSWSGDEVDEDAIRCLLTKQDEEAPERGLACAP